MSYEGYLVTLLCNAWNEAAYTWSEKVAPLPNWPLPEGIERIELRQGELWIKYKDEAEARFDRTM